jgi:hypothetical protein
MLWQNTAAVIHDPPAVNLSIVDKRNRVPIRAPTTPRKPHQAIVAVVGRLR